MHRYALLALALLGQVRGQYKSEKVIKAGFLTGSGAVFYRVGTHCRGRNPILLQFLTVSKKMNVFSE